MKTVADSTAIFSLQPGISLPRPQLMPIDLTTVTKKPKWSQVKQPNVNQSNISSAVDSTVFGMRKADLGDHYNLGKDRYQVECDQNYYASKLLVRNDSSILICNGIDYLVNQSETQQTSSVELNYRERGTNILSGDMEWIFVPVFRTRLGKCVGKHFASKSSAKYTPLGCIQHLIVTLHIRNIYCQSNIATATQWVQTMGITLGVLYVAILVENFCTLLSRTDI